MKDKIIIAISASNDSFGAVATNCPGIYGAGDSIDETKRDVIKAIQYMKEFNAPETWPEPIRDNWQIEWKIENALHALGSELLELRL